MIYNLFFVLYSILYPGIEDRRIDFYIWVQYLPHCLNLCLVFINISVDNTDSDSYESDGNEGNISEEDQGKSQNDHELHEDR